MSIRNPPRQRHLCAILAVFLSDFCDGGIVNEFPHALTGTVNRVLVAEGGVLLNVDVVLFVEGGEGALLEPGVEFDLVGCGHNGGFF